MTAFSDELTALREKARMSRAELAATMTERLGKAVSVRSISGGRWFVTSGRVSGGVSATRARPRGRASLDGTNASAVPETRRGPRFDHPVRGMGAGASAGAVL